MTSLFQRLRRSLLTSIGDIAFGMEDGAVSIAGLVFGVAASTSDSHVVLLAGATGAAAGAVSMMAGTYLDVQSVRDRGKALLSTAEDRIRADPEGQRAEIMGQLRSAGFTEDEASTVSGALERNPRAMLEYVEAVQLGLGRGTQESPWAHATWMFLADLLAAATPVAPFFFFEIGTARGVSLVITGALLAVLGVGRGRIAHRNVAGTVIQTLAIAALAAAAGVIIGRLVTG
ncbi:MAG: VIT1/CCC1 transporter family protein [Candidatus Limnocylindrales bacterium]